MTLSYTTIADWARLKDLDVQPHEVMALIAIDSAMLHPEEKE